MAEGCGHQMLGLSQTEIVYSSCLGRIPISHQHSTITQRDGVSLNSLKYSSHGILHHHKGRNLYSVENLTLGILKTAVLLI